MAVSYLYSILFIGDEVDACLHSGISALSQDLFLQSVDICGKNSKLAKHNYMKESSLYSCFYNN